MPRITQATLEAYLEEALPAEEMAAIELELRGRPDLLEKMAAIHARRDNGLHSVGEIWRKHRLSCPTREQLGSFLLEALPTEQATYIRFHVEVIGCRYCQSNLSDLREQQAEASEVISTRRTRYFQSTAGHLRGKS